MAKSGSQKIHICPKVTKMGSIIGHKIDYGGVGVLRVQWHIPSKNLPKFPPPPPGNRTLNVSFVIILNVEESTLVKYIQIVLSMMKKFLNYRLTLLVR